MLIRFALPLQHEGSHQAAGIFRGAHLAFDDGRLDDGEAAWLDEEVAWFNQHLPRPHIPISPLAIFWFRESAGPVLARAWLLARLAERAGWPVLVLRTRRPGRVVFEDAFQVAAIPPRDAYRARRRARTRRLSFWERVCGRDGDRV